MASRKAAKSYDCSFHPSAFLQALRLLAASTMFVRITLSTASQHRDMVMIPSSCCSLECAVSESAVNDPAGADVDHRCTYIVDGFLYSRESVLEYLWLVMLSH
jgi:hypothetical protein